MKNTRLRIGYFVAVMVLSLAIVCPVLSATHCVSTASELSTALTTATNNGEDDIIRVQQGTYNGNFIYASAEAFGVTIEGGYTDGCASRVANPAVTVLDGGNSGPVLVFSAPAVFAGFTVDALTLQNGNVTYPYGAGFYAGTQGTVTLNNCTISDNSSGGGVYFTETSDITLTNNTINNNSAHSGGGIRFNLASGTLTLINNTINNNNAVGGTGGGIFFDVRYTAAVILTNNTICNNNSDNRAGGIYFTESSGTVTLTNNTICNNNTNNSGGGIYCELFHNTFTLTNNTINNNNANNSGGGIWLFLRYDDAIAIIYNNIILNNSAGIGGGDLYIDNDGNDNYFPSSVNLFNNDFNQSELGTYIQSPFPIDSSNLNNIDPLFVDAENDDYHLTADSPLIDVGNNLAPELPTKDKDGKPRIIDGDYDGISYVDIGAYEYGSPRGDLDGDGDVDGEDLRIFAESYGTFVGP